MTPDIEGTINLDGEAVRFRIHPGGQQQWGASTTVLGRTVDVLTAMGDAARGTGFFEEPEPEERPSISHDEAQELHRVIGSILEAARGVGSYDTVTSYEAELDRALEIASRFVYDTDPDRDQ